MSDIKKSKTKYYVLAGLIVIIIAAILIIPRWNTYQHDRRAAAALEALESLKSYTENYVKTNQSASGFNVEAALVEIDISDKILKNWNFAIAWKPDGYPHELAYGWLPDPDIVPSNMGIADLMEVTFSFEAHDWEAQT